MKFKAIGFDIDGTLYPNYQMFLCTASSFVKHPALVYYFSAIRKIIRKINYEGDFHLKQAELLAAEMKIDKIKAKNMIEKNLYQSWDKSFKFLKPYSYVGDFIRGLRAKGYKTAALSDFPIGRKLEYMKLDGIWDAALCSEDSGKLKPAPGPFLEMADRLGLPPKDILYIGNSYKYDIIGASSAGMRTAFLGKNGGLKADYVFQNYKQLEIMLFGRGPD